MVLDEVLKSTGVGGVPYCDYALPDSTSGLLALEQTVQVIRRGTTLGLIGDFWNSDSPLANLLAIATAPSINRESNQPTAPITPQWALSLVSPFIISESCALQPATRIPRLEISSRQGSTMNFTWDSAVQLNENRTLFIGWVSGVREPVYTSVIRTSQNSGSASLPNGLYGYIAAVLTGETPGNIYDLTNATISGPAIAEVVF